MWRLEQDGDEIVAVHIETGRTLHIGSQQDAQELAELLANGDTVDLAEWLTFEQAMRYANLTDPERFPMDDAPYYDQWLHRRIHNATQRGRIATQDDPSDKRRALLNRDDFLDWMRTARIPTGPRKSD